MTTTVRYRARVSYGTSLHGPATSSANQIVCAALSLGRRDGRHGTVMWWKRRPALASWRRRERGAPPMRLIAGLAARHRLPADGRDDRRGLVDRPFAVQPCGTRSDSSRAGIRRAR